jgi:hypothetical protein
MWVKRQKVDSLLYSFGTVWPLTHFNIVSLFLRLPTSFKASTCSQADS